MTAPTPPGVWIVARQPGGVLVCTPGELRYAQECEEAYQQRLRAGQKCADRAGSEGGDGEAE